MRLHFQPLLSKLRSIPSHGHIHSHFSRRAFSVLTIHSSQVYPVDLSTSSQNHANSRGSVDFVARSTRNASPKPRSFNAQRKPFTKKWEQDEEDNEFQEKVRARRHAKLELRHLVRDEDIHVRLKKLLQTDAKKAEAMVKLLSREPNRAVAGWNILIDDALRSNPPKVNLAFKLYNQMKKSHQEPDEITLRTILNGIANNPPVAPSVPEKCLGLYNFWLAGRTPILKKTPPTTKDYNRLLSIVILGKKWDMMWQLVTDAPETGSRAPDSSTYGIVLEGIQGQMLEAEKDMREEHIVSALRVWKAVLNGCRPGKLEVDSLLVTKMGRFLVHSSDLRCLDAVFDLVKLTTGIPRYDESKVNASNSSDSPISKDQRQTIPEPESLETLLDSSFRNLGVFTPKFKVKPSIYILNVVLDACTTLHRKAAAIHYYSSFRDAGVSLDRVNLNGYLRVLRETRSAKEAVTAVKEYVETSISSSDSHFQKPSWGTFRIAMSACGRQRKDGGSTVQYATELYKLRQQIFPNDVDTQVMDNYLICIDLAINPSDRTEALKLVAEDLKKLINPSRGDSKGGPDLHLVKKVIGHIDRQENSGEVSREVFEKWKPVLSNYVFGSEKALSEETGNAEEHQFNASAKTEM